MGPLEVDVEEVTTIGARGLQRGPGVLVDPG
jgi:hypothetical protein